MKRIFLALVAVFLISNLALVCCGAEQSAVDLEGTVNARVEATLAGTGLETAPSQTSDLPPTIAVDSSSPTELPGTAVPVGNILTPESSMEEKPTLRVLWREYAPHYCSNGDGFFFMEGPGIVKAIDGATGEELWRWEDVWETGGRILMCDKDSVYLARNDHRLYRLDSGTGSLIWKTTMVRELATTELGGLMDGAQNEQWLYLDYTVPGVSSTPDHLIVAIDKVGGHVAWVHLAESNASSGPGRLITAASSVVLVAGADGLRGLDPASGAMTWQEHEIPGWNGSIWEGMWFGFPGGTGRVTALDFETGKRLWRTGKNELNRILSISDQFVYAEQRIIAPYVDAFDRETGRHVWHWPHSSDSFLGEYDGAVIVSDAELGFTWSMDPKTDQVLWENDDLVLHDAAARAENVLIAMRGRSVLYGIDLATGEVKWRRELPERSHASHFAVVNGVLIDGSEEGTLALYEPETGEYLSGTSIPFRHPDEFRPGQDVLLIEGGDVLVALTWEPGSP